MCHLPYACKTTLSCLGCMLCDKGQAYAGNSGMIVITALQILLRGEHVVLIAPLDHVNPTAVAAAGSTQQF